MSKLSSTDPKDALKGAIDEIFSQFQERFVIQAVGDESSSSKMGTPSADDFNKIVSFLDNDHGTEPADWFVCEVHASDNLVSRSIRSWHPNVLSQMATVFPGTAALLDHAWESANDVIGFVFDARVESGELPEAALTDAVRAPLNQRIATMSGYQRLVVSFAIPATDAAVDKIKKRHYNAISTGGYMSKMRLICPDCSEAKGRETTFTERDKNGDYVCPHLIPSMWDTMYEHESDEDGPTPASFLILDGVFDGIEVSFVVAGNLPLASVLRGEQ